MIFVAVKNETVGRVLKFRARICVIKRQEINGTPLKFLELSVCTWRHKN